MTTNTIYIGDCVQSLKLMAERGVKAQMCVTSPPYYGLRSYLPNEHPDKALEIGLEETPEQYVERMVEVFRAVRDVLVDDGTLWLNIGDSYYNYRPGKGQALVKQSVSSTKQDLPDVCPRRGRKLEGLKEKDLIGIPWMLAFALRADGWYLRQDIIWHKPNPMPESVRDRCTKAHEYVFLLSKSKKYRFDNEAIKVPVKQDWGTRNRENGKYHNEGSGLRPHTGLEKSYDKANRRSVWSITTRPYKGAHFAVFPPDLVEPCILAGSAPGDVVLDPFGGSGTVAGVAAKHGRNSILCELNPEYVALMPDRMSAIAGRECRIVTHASDDDLHLYNELRASDL